MVQYPGAESTITRHQKDPSVPPDRFSAPSDTSPCLWSPPKIDYHPATTVSIHHCLLQFQYIGLHGSPLAQCYSSSVIVTAAYQHLPCIRNTPDRLIGLPDVIATFVRGGRWCKEGACDPLLVVSGVFG